jgi:uncharacterized protein
LGRFSKTESGGDVKKDATWEKIAFRLHSGLVHRPFTVLAAALVLTGLSLWYTRGHMEFWTERNVLLSQKSPSAMRYHDYRQEFKDDYLIIVLSSKDLEQAKRFASRLGERLEDDPESVKEVFYRIPPEQFKRQALLFLEPEKIEELRIKMEKNRDLLVQLAGSPGLIDLLKTVNQRISRALVGTAVSGLFSGEGKGGAAKEPEEKEERVDPEDLKFLSSMMDSLYLWLTDAPRYLSPWGVFLQGGGGLSSDGYLADEEQGWVFVLAYLNEEKGSFNPDGAAIEKIREQIAEVARDVPDVTAGITGTPAINSSEMTSSLADMKKSMWLALVLVTVVFVLGFGEARRPLLAVLVLVMGVVWTLGWLCLTVGHLTILSMAFGSILIGLGIDFGIHVIARYEKEQAISDDPSGSLRTTLNRVGRSILSGGLTTAVAFLVLGLSSFRGIREFGWIAGWGVLFCLAGGLTVLPALLFLLDRRKRVSTKKVRKKDPVMERVLGWPARSPRATLLAAVCISVLASFAWESLRFDYNLLHLQPRGTEPVEWEQRLLEAEGNSSIFAVEMVGSREEAWRKMKQYEQLPLVSKVESLATYLPQDTEQRIEEVTRLAPILEDVVVREESPAAPDPDKVERWLAKIRFKLREEQKGDAALDREAPLPPPDTILGASVRTERVLRLLKAEKKEGEASSLDQYQQRLFSDFRRKIGILIASVDPLPPTLESLPGLMKKRFLGTSGKWLIQIYPKENVWELGPQRPFVEQLRTVSPEITGPAVANYESTRSLLDAYLQGGLYAMCAVLVILFVDFRHPLLVLLTLLPLGMAALWTLLGMRIFQIAFNPANLVIMPLLVGIGVDNGIHMVRHFLGAATPEEEIAGSSTGRAITLSTLTTMAGFGSLMIAHHQGIFSIGALLTLSMGSCLVVALAVLPSLLRVLPAGTRRRIWKMGQR